MAMHNYKLMCITKLIVFILCFTGIQSIAQQAAVTRLDKSRISFSDLDKKIQALMKAANVQGMAITIFNNKKTIYKKTFGYKRIDTKEHIQTRTNFYGASLSN